MNKAELIQKELFLQRELTKRKARRSLKHFVGYTMPKYNFNWHHDYLIEKLQDFANGTIKKLMVFMPPQHGKSQLVSRHLPAFLLGIDPNIKIASCSYNATFASKFNRDVKKIIGSQEYKEIFPETKINESRKRTETAINNAEEFEVLSYIGSYKSVGIGGALTGNTVDVGIIDDPIKDKAEANSEVYRNRVWEWFETVFETRLHNNSQQLITLTRWHYDDLAGRILDRDKDEPEKWDIVMFPAIKINEDNQNDPRKVGEVLWPEKHSKERIIKIKRKSKETFNSLYQQDPTEEGGNKIKDYWFKYVEELPKGLTTDIWIDGAYTEKTKNDPTGLIATRYDARRNKLYVFDPKFVRMELPELLEFLPGYFKRVLTNTKSKAYIEPKASGKSIKQMGNHQKLGAQFIEISTPLVTEGKESRCQVAAAAFEAGNIIFYRSGDQNEMENQLTKFPSYGHDEAVDLLGYACDHYFGVKRKGPKRRN